MAKISKKSERYVLEASGCIDSGKTEFPAADREEAVKAMTAAYEKAMSTGRFEEMESYLEEDEAYAFDAARGEAQFWCIYRLDPETDRKSRLINAITADIYEAKANELTAVEEPFPNEYTFGRILETIEELKNC